MADLQKYQASQPITPINEGETLRLVESGANRVMGAFQNFENKALADAQQLSDAKAARDGEQAGSDPNFKPGKPITRTDLVFQNAALEANKAAVQTDIATNVQRIRDEVLDPKTFGPDAVQKYNKLSQAYIDGALQSVPRETLPAAKNFYARYNQDALSTVTHHVDALTRNQLQYNLFDYLNKVGKQASDSAYRDEITTDANGDLAPAAAIYTSQMTQKLQAAVSTGLLPASTAKNLKDSYVSDAQGSYYLGQFSRVLKTEPSFAGEHIRKFIQSDDTDLNVMEKMKLVAGMHKIWKEYELEQSMNGINLDTQMKSTLAGVANGQPITAYGNIIAQVQAFKPDKFPEFWANLQAGEFSYTVGQALTYATPAQREAIIEQTKPNPFLSDGSPNPAYAPMIAAWNHFGDLSKKIDKEWKDDPAGVAIKHPSVVKAFEARNVAAVGPSLTDPASIQKIQSVTPGTIDPVQQLVNVQLAHGIPQSQVSVLTKASAATAVNELKNMELPQQVTTLNNMLMSYGPQYSPIVSRDLQKAGLEFTPLLLTGVSNNPQSRGALPDVIKAMQANPKDIEKTLPPGMTMKDVRKAVPGALNDWTDATQNYNGDTTQYRAQMQAAVWQYAAYLVATGKAKDPSSAAQSAADTLVNNFYSYAKFNGYKSAIPKQYDTSLVNKAFKYMWNQAKADDLKTPQLYASTFHTLGSDDLQRQYKSDSVSQAHLAVESGDKSAVLVDNEGSPITTKDGKTYRINFDDLGNPFSSLRTELDKQSTFKENVNELLYGNPKGAGK